MTPCFHQVKSNVAIFLAVNLRIVMLWLRHCSSYGAGPICCRTPDRGVRQAGCDQIRVSSPARAQPETARHWLIAAWPRLMRAEQAAAYRAENVHLGLPPQYRQALP